MAACWKRKSRDLVGARQLHIKPFTQPIFPVGKERVILWAWVRESYTLSRSQNLLFAENSVVL